MRFALLEMVDEIDALERFARREGLALSDFRIVAFEPLMRAELTRRGVSHESTLPYWGAGAGGSHERIIRAQEPAMVRIRERMRFTDDRGVRVAYVNEVANYVRPLLGHMFKVLEIVGSLLDTHLGAELFAAVSEGCTPTPLIGPSERYLGRVASRLAEVRGVPFTDIGGRAADASAPSGGTQGLVGRIAASIALAGLSRRRVVIVPRHTGPFEELVPRMAEADPGLVFLGVDYHGPAAKAAAGSLLGMLGPLRGRPRSRTLDTRALGVRATSAEVEELTVAATGAFSGDTADLSYLGVSCDDFVIDKVRIGIVPRLLDMLDDSAALAVLFERVPHAALLSYAALDRMAVAGELAERMGRRSLFVSHGSHPEPVDEVHALEMGNFARAFMLSEFTHAAIANPVQEAHLAFFRERMSDLRIADVRTGPLVFAHIDPSRRAAAKRALGIDPGETVVTHAVTLKNRMSERFQFLETLDESFDSLADVIRSAEATPGVRLLVRIHPGFGMTNAQIRSLLPEGGYVISRTGPFAPVLEATDVLLSYSSTAIDEALLNRVPILLYDKWRRYDHFKTTPFAEGGAGCWPVCYVDDSSLLAGALSFIRARLAEAPPTAEDVSPYVYAEDFFGNLMEYVSESIAVGSERHG